MEEALWAKLETRTRRLVFELLEPTVTRVSEHRETLEMLRRTDEGLSRKIDTLDILTEKMTKRLSLVDDFSRRIMQFDATIKVHEASFAQEREALKDQLESFLKQLTNAEENIALLQGHSQSLRTDLVTLAFETNNSKQILSNRIDVLNEDLKKSFQDLNIKSLETNNYFAILDKKLSNFMVDFEETDIIAKKAEHYGEDNSTQLKLIFKNFASFKKESKESIDKVRQMSTQFSQALTDQMKAVKEKVKNDMPIITQLLISENLHTVLEVKNRKLLAELEKMKYAEWDLMTGASVFENKIEAAKRKTHEALIMPMPKEEPIRTIEVMREVEGREDARRSFAKEAKQEPKFRKKQGKVPDGEISRSDIGKTERVEVMKVEKYEEVKVEKETLINNEAGKYNMEKELEVGIEEENTVINNDIETKGEKMNKVEVFQDKKNDDKIINTENPNKVSDHSLSEAEKPNSYHEEKSQLVHHNYVPREFSLEDIEKNSYEISQILCIKDYSEDIEFLHELIKKQQEDLQYQVKRLNNSDSALEEKLQMILKKQYESSLKFEELKTFTQDLSSSHDSLKNDLSFTEHQIYEKIKSESSLLSSKIDEISVDFLLLSKDTKAKMDILLTNSENLTKSTQDTLILQDKTLKEFYLNISQKNEILDLQVQQAAMECNAAVTQRKRDHHDNQAEFKRINLTFDSLNKRNDGISRNLDSISRMIQLLIEFSKITHSLQKQDEVDRESIALFGVKESKVGHSRSISMSKPSIIIDKQCLSCSGQPNFITSAFKLACLAYNPNAVVFKDTVYERSEMIELQHRIIEGISEETGSDFNDGNNKSFSVKPAQWRPLSRMSNFSVSPPMVSATPDLPPLSFHKKNY